MKKPFAVLSSLLLVAPVLFTTPAFAAVNPLTTPYNDGATPVTLYLNGTYQSGTVVDDSAIDWTKTANNNKNAQWLKWVNANGKTFKQMTYTKGNVDVKKPNGIVDQVNLNQYDDSLTDKNNGYWITSDNYAGANYLDAWVQELNGDSTYINNIKAKNEGSMSFFDTWPVWNFAALANSSGAVVGGASGTGNDVQYKVNPDGVTATPYLQITDTPTPTSSMTTDKQTYNAGDTVTITAKANVFAANTGYHDEAVYVTGPNNFKKFLNITSGSNGTVQAGNESDTQFPYWGVTANTVRSVWGGGSGNPSTPKTYNDTATLDTTGLTQGTYTVHYVLYDNVGRASTSGTDGEITTTFTVGPEVPVPPGTTITTGTTGTTGTGGSTGTTGSTTSTGTSGSSSSTSSTTPGITESPVTQKGDYGVHIFPVLWNHYPHMGDIGTVNVDILNFSHNVNKDGDWIGGYIDYTITATSSNPYFKGFTKSGEVFVSPPSQDSLQPSITRIPVQYTVAQRQDSHKGYNIQFNVSVHSVDKVIPGKPPTDIPALSDSDPTNDKATLNEDIPGLRLSE